jgi:hypothetical protein
MAGATHADGAIDREALVRRHTVTLEQISGNTVLQVGNGEIAYGIDPTGLQTFHGNTLSQWGWHSAPCPVEGKHAALKLADWDYHGRKLPYRSSAKDQEALYKWMRESPHRANLGRLRFLIKKADGTLIAPADVKQIRQKLDLWTGVIACSYTVEDTPVTVEVCADPANGALAVKAESALLAAGRMAVELAFPYGNPGKSGADWEQPDKHTTVMETTTPGAPGVPGVHAVARSMDGFRYTSALSWETPAELTEAAPHTFVLTPAGGRQPGAPSSAALAFRWVLSPSFPREIRSPSFDDTRRASEKHWPAFWRSGGAIDLSGSQDPRWRELERRVVLSQYLLAVNEAGSLPPQESGLYNNSGWYGKFHLEMHWWHGTHYALWNRWPLMARSLDWYFAILPQAKALAKSQGFTGARWPKMIGPDAEDSPSGTGPMLIWQQPHPIFYAVLDYRQNPSPATLEKWAGLIDETAEFMASFAFLDEQRGQYVLGPPVATVPENSNYRTSINPAFELSYWRTGLRWAQDWREKQGKPRVKKWDDVLAKLAPLPVQDGVYLSQENMPDTYTKMNWEHPSLIGPRGMLPGDGADPAVVAATVDKVWSDWRWDRCWGWDFPMMAMAAARNGKPGIAVDALLHKVGKNAYNGAGLSTGGPFPYFPSNGGLLYTVALMAAGWDGAPAGVHAPGFPQDGSWQVKWEGLAPAP